MKKCVVPLLSILMLSACGSSGGGSDNDDINTGNAEADALVASAENISNRFDFIEETEGETAFAAVGVDGGSAIYNGVAIFVEGTENGADETTDYLAIGSFEATAEFGVGQSVMGTADGFFEVSNPRVLDNEDGDIEDLRVSGPISGSFTFDLDITSDDGFAIAGGVVNGSLTKMDTSQEVFVDVDASGEFYGDELDAIEVNAGIFDGDNFTILGAEGLR